MLEVSCLLWKSTCCHRNRHGYKKTWFSDSIWLSWDSPLLICTSATLACFKLAASSFLEFSFSKLAALSFLGFAFFKLAASSLGFYFPFAKNFPSQMSPCLLTPRLKRTNLANMNLYWNGAIRKAIFQAKLEWITTERSQINCKTWILSRGWGR